MNIQDSKKLIVQDLESIIKTYETQLENLITEKTGIQNDLTSNEILIATTEALIYEYKKILWEQGDKTCLMK